MTHWTPPSSSTELISTDGATWTPRPTVADPRRGIAIAVVGALAGMAFLLFFPWGILNQRSAPAAPALVPTNTFSCVIHVEGVGRSTLWYLPDIHTPGQCNDVYAGFVKANNALSDKSTLTVSFDSVPVGQPSCVRPETVSTWRIEVYSNAANARTICS